VRLLVSGRPSYYPIWDEKVREGSSGYREIGFLFLHQKRTSEDFFRAAHQAHEGFDLLGRNNRFLMPVFEFEDGLLEICSPATSASMHPPFTFGL